VVTGPDSSIYTFGGDDGGVSDELYKLDVDTGEWHAIEPLGSLRPSARYGHAMTAIRIDIYLFGGSAEGERRMPEGVELVFRLMFRSSVRRLTFGRVQSCRPFPGVF
jgi:hypothetical protein